MQVPTPWAIPANLLSIKFVRLHLSAHYYDIIVYYAPESTNAYKGTLFISIFIYNIGTFTKFSGIFSYAYSLF